MITNINLSYDSHGSGPCIVLLHGFPLCRRMWRPQADTLAAAGYRVITPDLRGFGASPVASETAQMDEFADDVLALLDRLGIDRAVIGGMSMGGYVLFNLLERYPERLAAALMLVTRAAADDAAGRERREELARRALQEGAEPVADLFSQLLFAEATATQRPELLREVRDWMAGTAPQGLAAALRAMATRRDATALLPRITCPTLVIGAGEDRAIPVEHSRILAAAINAAELVVIPGAGHMVNLEQPLACNAAMLEFLAKLPRW